MSYDLYIAPREGFSRTAFEIYFSGRRNYTLDNTDAFYANDDTGVYFSFHLVTEAEAEAAKPNLDPASPIAQQTPLVEAVDLDEFALPEATPLPLPHIHFTLNYVRPHIFGLEAASELTLFVANHGDWIEDPQADGMGRDYSELGFLRGWDRGNQFGYSLIADRIGKGWVDAGFLLASSNLIEAVWRWNYARHEMVGMLAGEDVFAPVIVMGEHAHPLQASSVVVWGDGIPIAIPPMAQTIILARQQLRRPARGLFGRSKRLPENETTFALVKRQAVEALPSARREDLAGHNVIRIGTAGEPVPSDVVDFFASQPDVVLAKVLRLVAMDKVLNRELVDEMLSKKGG